MSCAKFDWNWPSDSGEENFLKLSMYFHYLVTGPVVLEKKIKMWKVYDNDNDDEDNDDDGQIWSEPSAQVS